MTYPRPVPKGASIGLDSQGRRINQETGNFVLTSQDGSLFEVVTAGIRVPDSALTNPVQTVQVVDAVQAGAAQYVPLQGMNPSIEFKQGELMNTRTGNAVAMTNTGKLFEIENVNAGAAATSGDKYMPWIIAICVLLTLTLIPMVSCNGDKGTSKACIGLYIFETMLIIALFSLFVAKGRSS